MRKITIAFLLFLGISLVVAQEEDYEDQKDQDEFQEIAQNLANFIPSQSFEIELQPGEQQTLIFWTQNDRERFRGLFYIVSQQVNGLFVGCEQNGELKHSFYDKKIGVFNTPCSETRSLKLILKSEIQTLKVYVSYEFMKKGAKVTSYKEQQVNNEHEDGQAQEKQQLKQVREKFQKIQNSVIGQEQILKSIMRGTQIELSQLVKALNSKITKAVFEAVVLIISGIASIWMLRREMKKGYELII